MFRWMSRTLSSRSRPVAAEEEADGIGPSPWAQTDGRGSSEAGSEEEDELEEDGHDDDGGGGSSDDEEGELDAVCNGDGDGEESGDESEGDHTSEIRVHTGNSDISSPGDGHRMRH